MHAQTYGSSHAFVYVTVNGANKVQAYRDEDDGKDAVTYSIQQELNKGDTVWIYFNGYFWTPNNPIFAYFEGHLTHQINN